MIESGIYKINKDSGYTSHDIVNLFRKNSKDKKIGHTGTLDPLATGLLIILVGKNYTKLQNQFLKLDKTYEAEITLGFETDTFDLEGKITQQKNYQEFKNLTVNQIKKVCSQFVGKITQEVPIYSAIKVHGKKLYELARRKRTITNLPTRSVIIHEIKLLNFSNQDEKIILDLEIDCSSGTYIRSLARDIGRTLGTLATLTKLKRTKIAQFDLIAAYSTEEIKEANKKQLLPNLDHSLANI